MPGKQNKEGSAMWKPAYGLTPKTAQALMAIEAAKTVVAATPLTPALEAALRHRARVKSTHHSTRIEGNRLSLAEAEEVIKGGKAAFAGRERDVREVRNYWQALLRVEAWAARQSPLTETLIQKLHALVDKGSRARPTPYRTGQNVIKDANTGRIVYLPPEAKDVPHLMRGLLTWLNHADRDGIPAPVTAGLAHYQFVTIHPYYDGNGRTARLLATLILQRSGYGLNGFLSVEEHHARNLEAYYHSLAAHPHHNYYEGRAEADLTNWVEYFVVLLAGVFDAARGEALAPGQHGLTPEPDALKGLDRRARVILALFATQENLSNADVARALGLSDRMARVLCRAWVQQGWLLVANPSNRARAYTLAPAYRPFIGNQPPR